MKMKPESYSLCEANIAFVRDQYKQDGKRNKSHWMDDLITSIREAAEKKAKKKKTEVVVADEDVILWLPCKSGQHPVTKDDVMQYMATYKNINMEQELKSMFSWLEANRAKQKTKAGMKRFINSWLSRANDKGVSGVWMGDY